MKRRELERLLGGYATGTLTAQERRLLFEAALTDQTLFNALADEQALKDLLDDPHARRQLMRALEERPGLVSHVQAWFRQPAFRAIAGGLAVALLAVTTVTRLLDMTPPPSETTEDFFQQSTLRPTVADKLAAKKKQAGAPKKTESREPVAVETKEALDAGLKQNKDADQQVAATDPSPEAVTERRTTDAQNKAPSAPAPGAKTDMPAGAAAPPATTAPAPRAEIPASPQSELLGRPDQALAVKPGTRDLFYGKTLQKEKDDASAERQRLGELQASSKPGEGAPPGESGRLKGLSDSAAQEKNAQASLQRLGLRYSLAKTEVGSARLIVEVNQNAYLYVFFLDQGEPPQLLFPNPLAKPSDAYVEKGGRYPVPSGSALPLRSEPSHVALVLTREPLRNLQEFTASGLRNALSKTRANREDREETTPQGSRETATYVVETIPSASSTLSIDIPLPVQSVQ